MMAAYKGLTLHIENSSFIFNENSEETWTCVLLNFLKGTKLKAQISYFKMLRGVWNNMNIVM